MNKLSIVSDGIYYSKENFKIKPNQSTNSYVNSTIELLKSKGNLQAALFDFGDGTYAYYSPKGTQFLTWENINQQCITPQLLVLHKLRGESKIPYKEFDILQVHPEMLNFLPIDSELKIKAFLNFVINVLNINYHPDDSFEDYLHKKELLSDCDGNLIIFDKNSILWFEALSELCLIIAGDNFYDWGTEILLTRLKIEQNLNESEMLHLSEDLNNGGDYQNIEIRNGHNLFERNKKPLESGVDVDSEDTTEFGALSQYEFADCNFDFDTDHDNTAGSPLNEAEITKVKIKKGGMHKALGIPEDEEIKDVIKSGMVLATRLIAKVGREKAAGMINYAANINGHSNKLFKDAQGALD